jgi:hypothetical protein
MPPPPRSAPATEDSGCADDFELVALELRAPCPAIDNYNHLSTETFAESWLCGKVSPSQPLFPGTFRRTKVRM